MRCLYCLHEEILADSDRYEVVRISGNPPQVIVNTNDDGAAADGPATNP